MATTQADTRSVWDRLADPVPTGTIEWRQDGKIITRDGRHFARFVAYIEANTARERLDSVVPGEWDLSLELLPPLVANSDGEEVGGAAFKARLKVMDVVREDVGTGRDYKAAATDAFKRAAVRFGIAHELYSYEQNWVQMDGDGRNAKPMEDPGTVYARKFGQPNGNGRQQDTARPTPSTDSTPGAANETAKGESGDTGATLPQCPKCGGRMWDNRLSKRNPKAPDYKCRDRSCDGVIWPGRGRATANGNGHDDDYLDSTPLGSAADEIPF